MKCCPSDAATPPSSARVQVSRGPPSAKVSTFPLPSSYHYHRRLPYYSNHDQQNTSLISLESCRQTSAYRPGRPTQYDVLTPSLSTCFLLCILPYRAPLTTQQQRQRLSKSSQAQVAQANSPPSLAYPPQHSPPNFTSSTLSSKRPRSRLTEC